MNVLLAIDGTKESDAAVDSVSNLTLSAQDHLRVLTVVDMALPLAHDIYSGMITNTVEIEQAAKAAAADALEQTVKLLRESIGGSSPEISTKIRVGSPESHIVEEAEEFGADLVVVGSHGYNRWERLLLGSVSDSVIHHAPCSVMVVRGGESTSGS